ncbi:hypothetical protein B23_3066 [Geobacillus thermoleovorans B23]|nr:hypothetical protein B23_3066 [Geobacillus thermoleovorans B23]
MPFRLETNRTEMDLNINWLIGEGYTFSGWRDEE